MLNVKYAWLKTTLSVSGYEELEVSLQVLMGRFVYLLDMLYFQYVGVYLTAGKIPISVTDLDTSLQHHLHGLDKSIEICRYCSDNSGC